MERLPTMFLTAAEKNIAAMTYPGYPRARLVIAEHALTWPPTLQAGEWQAGVDTPPTSREQAILRHAGYELDAIGRPLHPWLRDMITNPDIGVVTGKGAYWNWGPNYTADPIVLAGLDHPKLLLIQRHDTGVWALPGGFVDGDEPALTAALRELHEEAGLTLSEENAIEIYCGIVTDLRTTAHAWAETTAFLWQIPELPAVGAGDDALDAKWFDIHQLPDHLHGSHSILIEQAIARAR